MLFIIAILAVVAASIVYFNAKKRANRQESSLALVALFVAAFICFFLRIKINYACSNNSEYSNYE